MYTFGLSVLVAIIYAVGDSFATKYFEGHQSLLWLISGMILNALGVALFGYLANRAGVGVSSGLILSLNIVLNLLVGVLYFGDKLLPIHYVGLLFGMVGIVILSYY